MKEKWTKIREFFSRPRVIKWTVIILTVVIIVGALKALVWTIYTQDKPAFIPEEIRRDVQGAIVEKIGKPLQQISNPAGTFIINAAHKSQGNMYGLDKQETKDWPTYTSEEWGISFKYPEGWSYSEGETGVFSFGPAENSYDHITFYTTNDFEEINSYWNKYVEDGVGVFTAPEVIKLGNDDFTVYRQRDGMREVHYLFEKNGVIFDILPGGEGFGYVEKLLATIS